MLDHASRRIAPYMYRCLVLLILVLSVLTPAPLMAQNGRMSGVSVAPVAQGNGSSLAEVGTTAAMAVGHGVSLSATSAADKDKGRMDPYRALAQSAIEAGKKNDMATATRLCQELERKWDDNEEGLHKRSRDVWEQIDRAMDSFIDAVTDSGGSPPNAAALDAAYRDYLNKLKLAD